MKDGGFTREFPPPPWPCPPQAERQGDFSAGTQFGGTLTDDFLAQTLSARPGCAAAVQGKLRRQLLRAETAYASIFPGNVIPSACFDPRRRT